MKASLGTYATRSGETRPTRSPLPPGPPRGPPPPTPRPPPSRTNAVIPPATSSTPAPTARAIHRPFPPGRDAGFFPRRGASSPSRANRPLQLGQDTRDRPGGAFSLTRSPHRGHSTTRRMNAFLKAPRSGGRVAGGDYSPPAP